MKKIYLFLILILPFKSTVFSQNCTVNSGVDKTICTGSTIVLDGGIGGLFNSNTFTWSIVSIPVGATNTITNPTSGFTTAGTATIAGEYKFRISAKCSDSVTVADTVTITALTTPAAPTIIAPTNLNCYTGTPINLSTSYVPAAGETIRWAITGGNVGTFSNPTGTTTTLTPYFAPTECSPSLGYTISLTVTNAAGCTGTSTRTINITRAYPITAAANPTMVCGSATTLMGSCIGNTTSASSMWTQLSGPNNAVMAAPTARNTGVSGMIGGTYVFRYTVTGGCNPGYQDVTVTVSGGSAVTTAMASSDQYYCSLPGTVSINGNAPAVGETATWTQISGATATIASPNSPSTTVSGLTNSGQPYAFLYTISNGTCQSYDTVFIYQIPQLVFTTNDFSYCSPTTANNLQMAVATGNYYYGQLKYIDVSMTLISAPSGGSFVPIVRKSLGGGASPIYPSPSSLGVGQSVNYHITGDSLYHYPTYATRYNYTYNLEMGTWSISSIPGTYKILFTVRTECQTFEYLATYNKGFAGIAVNAGTDIMVNCSSTSTTLVGSENNGRGLWTTISMPTGATNPINSTNQTLRYPTITGLENGTYVFRYSANPGPTCTPSKFDEVKVVVSNIAPTGASVGPDATVCAGSTTLSGTAIPNGALAQWTLVSPSSSTVTFSNPNSATTLVSGLQPNTVYTFAYQLINGCGSSTDYVDITTTSSTTPTKPAISSGIDCRTVLLTSTQSTQSFVVKHPILPSGYQSSWNVFFTPTGPSAGTPIIETDTTTRINLANITASTIASIVYTVTNPACPAQQMSDTITFLIKKPNFTMNAGAPQSFCNVTTYPHTVTLTGTTTNLPVQWISLNSGINGAPQILSPNSNSTQVSIPGPGIYNFVYQINNTQDVTCDNFNNTAQTQVIVSSPGSIASAGNDTIFCNTSGQINLMALPITSGTGSWEVFDLVNGSMPTFSSLSSPTATLTFSTPGQVVLKWNSYGSVPECGPSSEDLVTITYIGPAQAGNDQQFCNRTSTTLNALNPTPATGSWSQVSGPNTAMFQNAASHQTTISNLIPGTYTFRWSVAATPTSCSSFDDVQIINDVIPVIAAAGPDQYACSGDDIQLSATAVPSGYIGTWTVAQAPTGASIGTFSSINNPNAVYSALTAQGTYTFAWTITNGTTCESRDYVVVDATTQGCSIALPVTLKSFRALKKDCSVELLWNSEKEEDFAVYELQRSVDGRNYETIASITPKGNQSQYDYLDNAVTDKSVFYRLKMVDLNGKYSFSNIIALELDCKSTNMAVYPNPSNGQEVTVSIITNVEVPYGYLKLSNSVGAQMVNYPVVLHAGSNTIKYPLQQIPAGTYTLQLVDENGKTIAVQKLVVH